MNYEEARAYIEDTARYGSVLGLDNIRELQRRLGNPENDLKFVHIAGTNGKGSTLAYLSTILKEAGYRVGRYISPALFSYREKIQVNEEHISREALARLTSRIEAAISEMVADGFAHPTQFEVETALSFLYFQEQKCDLVVLETGMGGITDATNIISTTVLEVIAKISMDHMSFLGNTLAEIAEKKAGIIKADTEVVSTVQEPEALKVLQTKAAQMNSRLTIADPSKAYDIRYGLAEQSFSYGNYKDLKIRLIGTYQIANAVTAVTAAEALNRHGFRISEQALRNGLFKTRWDGRFTILHEKPLIVMDGAHNPDGAAKLADSIEKYFSGRKIFCICGIFRDKDYRSILKTVSPYSDHLFAIETPDNPRALPAEELAREAEVFFKDVRVKNSVEEALNAALAEAGEEDVILAFGSLSFLGRLVTAAEKIN
ncbi:MAG: folylpolyglutamate synthase/dihydrofolate synthase family protein [Eubacteriales bacterium]|nr:folylpolyglutamate synthase/dihydrofolate synthase family protein [Eubacteriales bacterium]